MSTWARQVTHLASSLDVCVTSNCCILLGTVLAAIVPLQVSTSSFSILVVLPTDIKAASLMMQVLSRMLPAVLIKLEEVGLPHLTATVKYSRPINGHSVQDQVS